MNVALERSNAEPRGGVEPRIPRRDELSARAMPRHAARAFLRGRTEEFDEDAWTLLTSPKTDAELDRRAVLFRRTHPYQDSSIFGPDEDFGPHWRWRDFEQQESVVRLDEPAYVSPTGWVIRPPFQLIGRGLTRDHLGIARPDFRRYCATRVSRTAMRTPAVLTLRDPAEHNYYHLLTDLLAARVRLAAEAGIEGDLPLLVSDKVFANQDFQDVVRRTDLRDREIIVQQRGKFVRADGVVIVQTPWFSRDNYRFLQEWMGIPQGDRGSSRRLFIVRKAESGRSVANADALVDLARRYGFEIVSTEGMRLDQEIELFSQARVVVGLMGAALFNLVWRRDAPLSLLEIFPPFIKRADPYYFYLARSLGFSYRCYGDGLGQPYEQPTTWSQWKAHKDRKRVAFEVDTERLGKLIETMLEECG